MGGVRAAPVEEVEEAIRPGGLAPTKAVRIVRILEAIAGDEGHLAGDALAWLADAPLPEARDYLCALPGVGRKTAACVLLFSFGRHEVPVDTHVYRVGTRLGLFRPRAPLGRGARRDAPAHSGGRRLRGAHAAHPPRPPHLRGAQPALRRLPAAADVPRGPPPPGGGMSASGRLLPAAVLAVPFLIAIAALKGLTVEIDTFHGTDAGLYHLPTIRQFADHVDLESYPAAQTPLYHLLFAGFGKIVGFELWRLRLLNAAISYAAALALLRLLRRSTPLEPRRRWRSRSCSCSRPTSSGASFTLLTDNLALLLAFVALERIDSFRRSGSMAAFAVACLAICAAVLTRQSFVWLAPVAAVFLVATPVPARVASCRAGDARRARWRPWAPS